MAQIKIVVGERENDFTWHSWTFSSCFTSKQFQINFFQKERNDFTMNSPITRNSQANFHETKAFCHRFEIYWPINFERNSIYLHVPSPVVEGSNERLNFAEKMFPIKVRQFQTCRTFGFRWRSSQIELCRRSFWKKSNRSTDADENFIIAWLSHFISTKFTSRSNQWKLRKSTIDVFFNWFIVMCLISSASKTRVHIWLTFRN